MKLLKKKEQKVKKTKTKVAKTYSQKQLEKDIKIASKIYNKFDVYHISDWVISNLKNIIKSTRRPSGINPGSSILFGSNKVPLIISIIVVCIFSGIGMYYLYMSPYKGNDRSSYYFFRNFNGDRFIYTKYPRSNKELNDLSKFISNKRLSSKDPYWPDSLNTNPTAPYNPSLITENHYGVTSIGFLSYLIQTDKFNILVDPHFSPKGNSGAIQLKRIQPPGLNVKSLPSIDLIFITSANPEQLDVTSLKAIITANNPTIVTFYGIDSVIKKAIPSAKVIAINWDDTIRWRDTMISGHATKFYSERYGYKMNWTLWGAISLKSEDFNMVALGGTGYSNYIFKDIKNFFGKDKIDLALIPIGGYEPLELMHDFNMNPEESVKAFQTLDPRQGIATKFGVFRLSDESYIGPMQKLDQVLDEEMLDNRSLYALEPGKKMRLKKSMHLHYQTPSAFTEIEALLNEEQKKAMEAKAALARSKQKSKGILDGSPDDADTEAQKDEGTEATDDSSASSESPPSANNGDANDAANATEDSGSPAAEQEEAVVEYEYVDENGNPIDFEEGEYELVEE